MGGVRFFFLLLLDFDQTLRILMTEFFVRNELLLCCNFAWSTVLPVFEHRQSTDETTLAKSAVPAQRHHTELRMSPFATLR